MNISGRMAERLTGYFARCRSISASTSAEKTAISCGTFASCGRGLFGRNCSLITFESPRVSRRRRLTQYVRGERYRRYNSDEEEGQADRAPLLAAEPVRQEK